MLTNKQHGQVSASAKPMPGPDSVCSRGKAYKPSQVHGYHPAGSGVTRITTAGSSDLTMCIPQDFDISKLQSLVAVQLAQHTHTVTVFLPN